MALLAEEVVEEWLNRQGYFTIRGIRLGVHEIDLLAIKPKKNGKYDCRHIEVSVSTNPIAYNALAAHYSIPLHGICFWKGQIISRLCLM
ncbi:MAG: hypothetical protein PF904_21340 [Kiritimatiellae bacterium]|jgi:hypothetical protein|nr:hypothetical protein [Kiritimatiellia bacterium]